MEDKITNQEEQFRALTEDFTLDIDTAELWDKVEAHLPPVHQKRRRLLVWWFATGLIVVVVAGILFWNSPLQSDQKNIIADNLTQSSIHPDTEVSIDLDTKHTDNSPILENLSESSNTHQTTAIAQAIPGKSLENKQIDKSISTTTFDTYVNNEKPLSNNEKALSKKESLIAQSQITQLPFTALVNPSTESEILSKPENQHQKRDIISFEVLHLGQLRNIENDAEYDFPEKLIKPLKSTLWLPFYAFSSGVNMHKSNILSNSSEGLDLTQFEDEKSLLGLSTDLQFGYENNNGWRFGIGLNHNRLVSRKSQNETVAITSEVNGNATSKIDDEGSTSHVNGALLQTTVTNYDFEWHRTHDFINAQLLVGKKIFRIGNLSAYTNATIGKNIWSNHTGYYFSEGNELITRFASNEKNPYSNAGYNVGLDMAFEYKINEISISLKSFGKVGLNSITQNSNYYQIKNSHYGIQLGVVYRP